VQFNDPTSAALDALARANQPGWRSAVPALLHGALGRWPGHPDILDALCTLSDNDAFVEAEGHALVPVLVEAASAVRKSDSAPLHAHAARLCWIYEDADMAFGHLIEALSADPHHADARALLSELLSDPDEAPAISDGLETLALRAVRGDVDKQAVLDIINECGPTGTSRARSLLGH